MWLESSRQLRISEPARSRLTITLQRPALGDLITNGIVSFVKVTISNHIINVNTQCLMHDQQYGLEELQIYAFSGLFDYGYNRLCWEYKKGSC
jgi:hypothetical protein